MCRNIRVLYNFEPPATIDEIEASALQYVRKVSGMTRPSQVNQEAFERAVAQITEITRRLLIEELRTRSSPRDREIEKQRATERGRRRVERIKAALEEDG